MEKKSTKVNEQKITKKNGNMKTKHIEKQKHW
jgi:hypothetical protein